MGFRDSLRRTLATPPSQYIFAIVGCCLCLPIVASLLLNTLHQTLFVDSSSLETDLRSPLGWDTVHYFSNAYFHWSFSPPIRLLTAVVAPAQVYSAAFLLHGLIFVMAFATLTRQLTPQVPQKSALLIGLFVGIVLLAIFGIDTVLFSVAPFWLLLVLATRRAISRETWGDALLLGAISCLAASGCGELILPIAFTAAVVALSTVENPKISPTVVALLIAPALLSTIYTSLPRFPDYTPPMRVVADVNTLSRVEPLFAGETPIQFIDRAALRNWNFRFALGAFVFLGLSALLIQKTDSSLSRRKLGRLSFALIILLLLDSSYFSEAFSQQMPLQNWKRFLPTVLNIPLSPFCALLSVILISLTALGLSFRRDGIALLACMGISLSIIMPISGDAYENGDARAVKDIPAPFLNSPARHVLKYFHSSAPLFLNNPSGFSLRPLSDLNPQLTVSAQPQDAQFVLDNDPKTRWSPQHGGQTPGAWLQICFPESANLTAISFSTGNFPADFPRGVRICRSTMQTQNACGNGNEKLFESEDWQGPMNFTASGWPYFGSQSEVLLPLEGKTQCLRLEQISTAPFDWSVAEIYASRAE